MDQHADFVDFHCHLDLYPDPVGAYASCERVRVRTLAVTTTPKAWPRNRDLAKSNKYVQAALGLHPQVVAERLHELPIWEQYLPQAQYIGEVGLDAGPQFVKSMPDQVKVLDRVLAACGEIGGRIVSLHAVRSTTRVLDLVEKHLPNDRGAAVMHWFSGTGTEARRALELGLYFSVNSRMLRSESGRRFILSLPRDRILTETDGPFIQTEGRPSTPADARTLVDELGRTLSLRGDMTRNIIGNNLRALLSRVNRSEF